MKITIGPYPKDWKPQEVDMHIDDYDTWNMNHTLGQVIVACLRKFIEIPHGAPYVDNADVPEYLHRSQDAACYTIDDHWFKRWEWILTEMLFAFDHGVMDGDSDKEASPEDIKRADNGRLLFAKYFHHLWN